MFDKCNCWKQPQQTYMYEYFQRFGWSRNHYYCYCTCTCSTPSCDHFGRHGEWKKYLATKILVKVANWRPTDLKRNLLEKIIKNTWRIKSIVQVAASPVSLFSLLVVQEVESVNLKWAAAQNGKFDRFEGVSRTIGNVTQSQQLCNVEINLFCYWTVSSFCFSYWSKAECWKHAFGASALRVICHKVSTSKCFSATEFLFMATILKLKVAKRRFFEKVSLERWHA